MEEKFNVIIPAAYKDFAFLQKTISYVAKNIQPQKIYVIIDTRLISYMPKVIINNTLVEILDENKLVDSISFEGVKKLLVKHGLPAKRTGWFLQQFIKLGFALSEYCDTDYYLSWDADTLPLRNIEFFTSDGKPIFTKKKEHNQAYFDTLSKILELGEYADFSYIAEHMMFNKNVMTEMLGDIEKSPIYGDSWYEKIINATDSTNVNSFSEFETYGNFCLNHYPNMYATQVLNTFRKAGYIAGRFISDRKLNYMSFDLDTASFELGDYPSGIEKYFCFAYHKYLKFKEQIIKKKLKI